MFPHSSPGRWAKLCAGVVAAVCLTLSAPHARAVTARPGVVVARPAPQGHPRPAGLPRVAEEMSEGRLRIVALGSSSTQGIGASSAAASYPNRLQADLSVLLPHVAVVVINQGIGGQDAVELAARLPAVLSAHPDLVIFQTGTNDSLRGLPLPRFVALTRDVVRKLREAGIDVMLMEPQACRLTLTSATAVQYRDAVRVIAAEMHVPIIRRWDLMQSWLRQDQVTQVQMLAPDGLHMADAGYTLLARAVAQEILAQTR